MKNKYLYIVVFISSIFAVLPFIFIYKLNNFSYPKIPVEIVDDSVFYYSRMVDVYKGNYFIGNPYVLEHKDEVSANFFVADWLASIPLFLGLSLNQSIIFNQFFYFIIFGLLLFCIFRKIGLSDKASILGVVFCFISTYWYLARPVSMQVVYPSFIGFLMVLYFYIKNPDSKEGVVVLGVYAGLSLYIYTYLAQIMAISFVFIFLSSFHNKCYKFKSVFYSGLISLIFGFPFIFYTLKQVNSIYYIETVNRLGLLRTHLLGGLGLYYLAVCSILLLVVFIKRTHFDETVYYFFQLISGVLALIVVSNIFTGIDFELATHIGKFIELWTSLIFVVIFSKVYAEIF